MAIRFLGETNPQTSLTRRKAMIDAPGEIRFTSGASQEEDATGSQKGVDLSGELPAVLFSLAVGSGSMASAPAIRMEERANVFASVSCFGNGKVKTYSRD